MTCLAVTPGCLSEHRASVTPLHDCDTLVAAPTRDPDRLLIAGERSTEERRRVLDGPVPHVSCGAGIHGSEGHREDRSATACALVDDLHQGLFPWSVTPMLRPAACWARGPDRPSGTMVPGWVGRSEIRTVASLSFPRQGAPDRSRTHRDSVAPRHIPACG